MKILFIDTTHPVLTALFEEQGWEVVLKNETSKEELAKELHLYDGITKIHWSSRSWIRKY